MANDILQLLNTNKDDIKKIFQNIIIAAGSQISVENGSNSLNNLLKYKSYLSYILPLLIIKQFYLKNNVYISYFIVIYIIYL